jgi:hypothetical protein
VTAKPGQIESPQADPAGTFDRACALVATALGARTRQDIVTDASTSKSLRAALLRLRDAMLVNVWKSGDHRINLDSIIRKYERRTRHDGFHVLHDWDGRADQVSESTIPIDVLDYLAAARGAGPPDRGVLAILLDYYFLHVLALLSLRIWDDGDADGNLDRVNQLLRDLQGPHGSGQQFAANAETLILIATSHFEIQERGYDKLLERVRALNRAHRTNVALTHAASMGSHLRFGFEATYGRDIARMREDNIADYPWLCFALATLIKEYARMRDEGIEGIARDVIVEGMLNGLSPDARAFAGERPAALHSHAAAASRNPGESPFETERLEFHALFGRHRDELLSQFERYRPSANTYSPISFFFNFSHNVLKGIVVDALLRAKAWSLTLNDLLTGLPRDEPDAESRETLAKTLMGYARSSPDRIGGRLMPVIVYDPWAGRRAFAVAMRKLKE